MEEVHRSRGRIRGGCFSGRTFLYQGTHELGVGEAGEEGVGVRVREGGREGGRNEEVVMMSYPEATERNWTKVRGV